MNPKKRLVATGGSWETNRDYYYFETTPEGRYLYVLVDKCSTDRLLGADDWDIEYNPSDGKFYDVGSGQPHKWGFDDIGTNISAFPTLANMQTHYFYGSDSGSLRFQFTNPYHIAPEPGYKYIAFYGRSGSSNGWLYELELSTTDGLIDYNNPIPVNQITILGNALNSDPRWMNPSCIFDGEYTQPDTESVIFYPNLIGVLFYMKNSINVEVQSGSYWTYESPGPISIEGGAIYGTNTDPSTFDATDEANWDYVCDLTAISETGPHLPVARLVPTGGSWQGEYDYYYFETTQAGRYLYDLVPQGTDTKYQPGGAFSFEYDPNDGKFYDVGSEIPYIWGIDDIGTNLSAFPTSSNMEKHYFYHSNGDLKFQFDNPYYVAPSYRYLAFYGTTGSANGWFYELELTTTKGLIDYNNPIPVDKITVVAPIHANSTEPGEYNNPSAILMDITNNHRRIH